jgi:hypothetical protein
MFSLMLCMFFWQLVATTPSSSFVFFGHDGATRN